MVLVVDEAGMDDPAWQMAAVHPWSKNQINGRGVLRRAPFVSNVS
ncbi:MAG: hypothetical protein WCN98_00830 [Verrucomicrobiaceae bacterium]